ncbi:MAG: hypothetical protein LBU51_00045 [Bacteroidales bacterium]|nr:hypothetical protein [Bacteroidales bacterium]
MKKLLLLLLLLPFSLGVVAQDTVVTSKNFNRHEIKLSYGDAFLTNVYANIQTTWSHYSFDYLKFGTTTLSYHYRALKYMWIGADFSVTPGSMKYTIRSYYNDQLQNIKTKNLYRACIAIAPSIRFSYLNREKIVLYSGLSIGLMINTAFNFEADRRFNQKMYNLYVQPTFFGFNYYPHKNVAIGGEFACGSKGFLNAHIAYSF